METVKKRNYKKSVSREDAEDWTVIYCDTADEVEQCIADPSVIWPILQRSITRLIVENRESLPAIEIRCMEMLGSVWVNIRRSEVLVTLNKLLNWRETREEYEECVEIRDLIDEFVSIEDERKSSASSEGTDTEPEPPKLS